jgi:opacity protein-like surface antigen
MKRILVAAVLVAGFASPALAGHCPKDVKLIDAALANQSNAEAKALRDKGAAAHAAGKHGDSLADLHAAMKMLDIKH